MELTREELQTLIDGVDCLLGFARDALKNEVDCLSDRIGVENEIAEYETIGSKLQMQMEVLEEREQEKLDTCIRQLHKMLDYYKACEQKYGNEPHNYQEDVKRIESRIEQWQPK